MLYRKSYSSLSELRGRQISVPSTQSAYANLFTATAITCVLHLLTLRFIAEGFLCYLVYVSCGSYLYVFMSYANCNHLSAVCSFFRISVSFLVTFNKVFICLDSKQKEKMYQDFLTHGIKLISVAIAGPLRVPAFWVNLERRSYIIVGLLFARNTWFTWLGRARILATYLSNSDLRRKLKDVIPALNMG